MIDRIRILTLDAPYDHFDSPETQRLLCEALALKRQSYQNVYPDGVLPLDTYDFISTHHMVAVQDFGPFKPVMVFRTIRLDRCDYHRVAFPGIAVLRGSGAHVHAELLDAKLHAWRAAGESVSYGSGWAMSPALRDDRDLRNLLKDLMTGMLVNHECEIGTSQLVACGTARVHTDDYFQNIGYRRMEGPAGVLPPFPQASLIGVDAVLLQTPRFNEGALELAEKFRSVWERREVIARPRPTTAQTRKIAKAA